MPLILGTNSIKDTGYDVANSLRFNSGSSDSLDRTISSSPTDMEKFTISVWVKRSKLGSEQAIIGQYSSSNFRAKIDFLSDILSFGALGQTRTVTPLRARILSPLCLPFHHEGFSAYIYIN